VGAVTGRSHHSDDLLDLRRIRRVANTLVARRAAREKSRHCRWRSATTGTIELLI
jgi:hypothetical protein